MSCHVCAGSLSVLPRPRLLISGQIYRTAVKFVWFYKMNLLLIRVKLLENGRNVHFFVSNHCIPNITCGLGPEWLVWIWTRVWALRIAALGVGPTSQLCCSKSTLWQWLVADHMTVNNMESLRETPCEEHAESCVLEESGCGSDAVKRSNRFNWFVFHLDSGAAFNQLNLSASGRDCKKKCRACIQASSTSLICLP